MPLYLKADNVSVFNANNQKVMDIQKEIDKFLQDSKDKDGIIIHNLKDAVDINKITESATHIMVREPNQIKSVNNRGTYSPDIGNIYYQSKITDLFKPVVNEVKNFIYDLRKAEQSEKNINISVGTLPTVYEKLGFKAGNVKTNRNVLLKDTTTKHKVPVNIVENLPNLYSDPLMVFESSTQSDRLVAVLDAKDTDGNQVIVAISPNKKEVGGYHFIPSFYGKEKFTTFVKNNIDNGRLKYIKGSDLSDSLQLWTQVNQNLSNNNYITKEDIVNTNITTTEDTILNQNANGFFDSELKAIVLGSDFNFGTLPHEMAHFFLEKNFKIWKQGNAPEKFMKDFNAIANILGISPKQKSLTKDQQEMYASMTEAYIFGKGVPQGTEATLKTYWDWCPPQYNNILDIGFRDSEGKIQNPILTKDIMEYFDNMYSQLALIDSPYSQSLNNPTTNEGDKIPANKDERIERLRID